MDACWDLFVNAIKTEATKESYTNSMKKFKEFSKVKTYKQFKKLKTEKLKGLLVSYIVYLNSKNLAHSSVSLYLSAIELFLDMNEINYPKRVIRKLLPADGKKQGGERPYTTEEIKRMLEVSPKLRTKALIHFFNSTGIRPNALHDPIVKLSDLIELPDGCQTIMLYKDSKEEYWSFLTPEAVKSINNYIRSRKLNGEHFDDDSPLFENKGKPIKHRAIRHILTRVINNAVIERSKKGNRYDKALVYGFRKRFNTILKISDGLNPNIAEKLMAHKRGLDGVYLKPTMEECHKEFIKAIPELIIDPTLRQELEITKKQQKIDELEAKTSTITEQESRIKQLEENQKRQDQFLKLLEKYPQIKEL